MIEKVRVARREEGGKLLGPGLGSRLDVTLAIADARSYSHRVGAILVDILPARSDLFPYTFRMEGGGMGLVEVSA